MSARGLFITVEGGEGTGKSTALEYVARRLREGGVPLRTTREPGGCELAEELRQVLLSVREEPVDDLAELLVIFAARAQHLARLIQPALAAGEWVLCDRFTDASYAYQAGGRGLPVAWVQQLETLVQGELRPDCTLLLDASAATGLERAQARGELDRFERERLDFYERVRHTYLRLAAESSGRYRIIDAGEQLPQVQAQLDIVCAELLACQGSSTP
jgi:dTMP kinase